MGAAEPPLGAAVLVSRRRPDGEREWLILHRALPLGGGTADWAVFAAEAPPDAVVSLDFEHDRYEWVTLDEAERRCLPASVGTAFRALAQ
jgi:hypothetical protein